jgi:hypothetical protein
MTIVYSQLQLARAASNTFVESVATGERATSLERKVPGYFLSSSLRIVGKYGQSAPRSSARLSARLSARFLLASRSFSTFVPPLPLILLALPRTLP